MLLFTPYAAVLPHAAVLPSNPCHPVCQESKACIDGYARFPHLAPMGTCKCSGYSNEGPLLPNLEVVDSVMIPASLASGRHVLQWRYATLSLLLAFAPPSFT